MARFTIFILPSFISSVTLSYVNYFSFWVSNKGFESCKSKISKSHYITAFCHRTSGKTDLFGGIFSYISNQNIFQLFWLTFQVSIYKNPYADHNSCLTVDVCIWIYVIYCVSVADQQSSGEVSQICKIGYSWSLLITWSFLFLSMTSATNDSCVSGQQLLVW